MENDDLRRFFFIIIFSRFTICSFFRCNTIQKVLKYKCDRVSMGLVVRIGADEKCPCLLVIFISRENGGEGEKRMKCILTVIGKDKPGIIAKVSALLADAEANIEDISQTIMQDMFTMIMLVRVDKSKTSIEILGEKMKKLGDEIGVSIRLQHEDVFNAMHRV